MYKPNYKDGSIVNLASSIKKALGGKSRYGLLKDFNISSISKKNIVLLLIDGLGYEYLIKHGKQSILYKNLKTKITSVFPTASPVAITSLATAVAPQQHSITGWYMYLKEIEAIIMTWHSTFRAGDFKIRKSKIGSEGIYSEKSIFEDIRTDSVFIKHKKYSDSEYFRLITKGAKQLEFSNLDGLFRQINKMLDIDKQRKFIFTYNDEFDSVCHKKGVDSKQTKQLFDELDKRISLLAKSLKDKNTAIIITADHGLIDVKGNNKLIELRNHPELVKTLSIPICGDRRVIYCYVKPRKTKQFENYVKTNFKKYCEIHKSEDLIKNNYFGLFKPNEKLNERIGDYVLIMKENYVMKDSVLGKKQYKYIGDHGSMSKEEMFVPLIVIE